jgi:hypothetical protein
MVIGMKNSIELPRVAGGFSGDALSYCACRP